MKRSAFTVIEVVIVIALIILIIALALPGMTRAHSGAVQAQHQNNLRQLGIAMHSYNDVFKKLPNNGVQDKWANSMDPQSGSWLYRIAPYVEQVALYKNPDAFKNVAVPLFLCPARTRNGVATVGKYPGPVTDYAINGWLAEPMTGSPASKGGFARIHTIPDGSSNTFLIGQLALRKDDYQATDSAPGRETFLVGGTTGTSRNAGTLLEDEKAGPIDHEFGSPYPGGAYFIMGDAAIRKVSYGSNVLGGLKPNDDVFAPEDIMGGGPRR